MRFDLPDDKRFVFEMVIPIRWGDMDAYGHVNNTIYFRYFETLRIEWMAAVARQVGTDLGRSLKQGPVIVNAFCTFHRQLEFPGEVLARQYVGKVGRSSFETYGTLSRTDAPDVVYASGGSKVVWSQLDRQVAVMLPGELADHLRG